MTDFQTLVTPDDAPTIKASILAVLRVFGFPTDGWGPFSFPRALLEGFSAALADASKKVAAIAGLGFRRYSSGDWLTVLARERYEIDRELGQKTIAGLTMACPSTAGPYTVAPGDLVVAEPGGLLYTNRDGFTLASGGTISGVAFVAESSGSAFNNVPSDSTWTFAQGPLPGVTLTNPFGWLIQQGTDDESDDALKERMADQWSALGAGANDDAYLVWAKAASAEVVRAKVLESIPNPGQVTLVVCGPSGPVTPTALAAVQAYIDPPSHLGKAPNCIDVFVRNVAVVSVAPVGVVTCDASKIATSRALAGTAFAALGEQLGIGGTVRVAKLIDLLMNLPGVVDVAFTSPAANVAIGGDSIASVDASALTWVAA